MFDSEQRWIWTADQVKGESWAWVVYFDKESLTLTFRRIEYNIRIVQDKMNNLQIPAQLSARLTYGE